MVQKARLNKSKRGEWDMENLRGNVGRTEEQWE